MQRDQSLTSGALELSGCRTDQLFLFSCSDLNSLPVWDFFAFPARWVGRFGLFFFRFNSRAAGLATGGFGLPLQ